MTPMYGDAEARYAQRDRGNLFDLNSANPNDVAPLDFPGPAFDVTPAGLRQSGSNLNEPSTSITIDEVEDTVEISGVGRPVQPNPPAAFKPQGGGAFSYPHQPPKSVTTKSRTAQHNVSSVRPSRAFYDTTDIGKR